MDTGTIAQWAAVAVAIGVALLALFKDSRKDLKAAIAEVAGDVANQNDRITKIERDIQHLPDKEVTHRLELALSDLKSDVGILTERLKPVAAIGDRLQEFLLEQARAPK